MRIALFEDNRHEAAQLVRALEHHLPTTREPVSCVCFDQIDALRSALRGETFDLLIFDAGAENAQGIEMLRWLRKDRDDPIPVIMLSGCTVDSRIAEALEAGADDYVVKPSRPMELRARIRKLLQRRGTAREGGPRNTPPMARVERFGHWSFDHGTSSICIEAPKATSPAQAATCLNLTHREFVILLAFFRRIGQIVSRAHLIEIAALREEDIQSRALDNHVYRLRKRFESQPHGRIRLRTIYTQGYRLEWVNNTAQQSSTGAVEAAT